MFQIPDPNELRIRMQLEARDARLLQLLFSSQVSSDEKANFFKSLRIEKESMEFNLMLAHLCHRHGYQGIPSGVEPLIRGAARFYLFKNAALFSSFRPLGQSLNAAGIPMLLLKGAAVKAAYDTASCRCLTDIDFAVPKQLLQDAIKLAKQQDYRVFNETHHSIDMKQPGLHRGSIDIHYRLFKTCHGGCIEDELADGAKQIHAFGVDAWVSSPERLLFQLLENAFFNLCMTSENRRHFKWIYDCGMVLSSAPAFDWARVVKAAEKHHLDGAIRSMLLILTDYFPQHVPKSLFHQPINPTMDRYMAAVLKWGLQGAHRAKLSCEGKKWRSLFLRPSQMATEYRFLQMDGTVSCFREFMFMHCRAKNYSEMISWIFDKLRTWKKGAQLDFASLGAPLPDISILKSRHPNLQSRAQNIHG